MREFSRPHQGSGLAGKLAEARSRMAELQLPGPLAARLHRRFIALCDAAKAPGADEARAESRVAAFLATLDALARNAQENRQSPKNS